MFSSKISRVAHRVSPAPISANASSSHRTAPCFASSTSRCSHQRRRSSSKASCPPDSSSSKSAPAAKSTTTPAAADATSEEAGLRATSKRTSKYRRPTQDKTVKAKTDDAAQYATLPAVPRVQHLQPRDFGLSSFFSLHRPLSLTNPLPPPVTDDTFSSIFNLSSQDDLWADGNSAERRPEDVIYALSQTIETIENASSAAQNDVVHIDVLQESPSNNEDVRHLDGTPRSSIPTLDEIVAQAKPFQTPPPPQPFNTKPKQEKKRVARQAKTSPRTKSYTTTIVVTESMSANGQKTYEASASPIVRLPDPVSNEGAMLNEIDPTVSPWTPYRRRRRSILVPGHHSRSRQRSQVGEPDAHGGLRRAPDMRRPDMLLISVKRQRKLKMKKHKYKKLMKRTRNLRRRMENK